MQGFGFPFTISKPLYADELHFGGKAETAWPMAVRFNSNM